MKKIFVIVFAFFLASCSEDPNEAANKMFVEAQQLVSEAEDKPREQAMEILQTAINTLNEIVEEYPASDLAVQISSGEPVGEISITAVQGTINNWEEGHTYFISVCAATQETIPHDACECGYKLFSESISHEEMSAYNFGVANRYSDNSAVREAISSFRQKYRDLEDAFENVCGLK